MQMVGVYKTKKILIKDSYSIISKGLSAFPSMFKLNSGEKEAYHTIIILVTESKTRLVQLMKR